MKQINDYDTDITALTAEVERLGEAGQIDESMETLTKIEEIRAKKEEAEVLNLFLFSVACVPLLDHIDSSSPPF